MKRKILIAVMLIISIGALSACSFYDQKNNDALKFKEEYESLNGTRNENGKVIRNVTIDDNNPMKYATAADIVKMVQNKETFVVYFGFASCPWCRSVVTNLIQASLDLGIDTIYYVDVTDIRDTMKLGNDGEIVIENEGSNEYFQLLEMFDDVLSEYTLKNSDGEIVYTGEKRIFAPNIISVVNGNVEDLTTGISEKQTDGYMELTNEMNQESYNLIKCTIQCVADEKNTCSAKSVC